MIISALAQAIGVGTASIVSRRLGAKKAHDAAAAMGTAYTAVFLFTALLIALFLLFIEPILGFFGASEATMPYALAYSRIVAPGFFFFALSMLASNLMRAEGKAKAAMTSMLLGAGMNLALDPILIFGFGMGVEGAAIATVASQAASCLYLLSIYVLKKNHIVITARDLGIKPALLAESAVLGIPAFLQSAGMSILALLINTTLGRHGGDGAISTYGMMHRTLMIIIMPIIGIIQGFQPIVGFNYGAKNFARVRRVLKVTALTAFGMSLIGYFLMMALPDTLMRLFTRDAELIRSSARALRIAALFIPLASLQIMGATYFQAVGKRAQSLLLGLMRQFIILIPVILTLPRLIGVDGVWFAFPIADLVSTCVTGVLLMRELRHLETQHGAQVASAAPPPSV